MPYTTIPGRRLALLLAVLFALAAPFSAFAQEAKDTYDAANPQNLTDADLVGKAALVLDAQTGTVLYNKNGNRKAYPASTTKIMTCLVALENFPDLNRIVTIGPEARQIEWDSSKMGLEQGEQFPMIDLLYGMMMRSGNDAAMTIAVTVAGSVDAFVAMMNQRAKELGCADTHFSNPHGYHDEAHVSTAYDLALIAREAMKNRTFREIVAAKSYTLSATNLREKRRMDTMNNMYVSTSKFYYPDLIGIKTGTHSKAGQCFVGAADKDGVELISVVLKSSQNGRWTDTARLMDYAITRYETLTFSQMFDQAPIYASIKNASRNDENAGLVRLQVVPGTALDTYVIKCLPEYANEILTQFGQGLSINYTNDRVAPIQAGDILGTITMEVDGAPVTATVIASRAVEAEATPFTLESLLPGVAQKLGEPWIVTGVAVLVLAIVLIAIARMRAAARNRRRRREMLRRRKAAYDRYRNGADPGQR